MRTVLLTGGMGFIGSHTAVEFLKRGDAVILADDLSNSRREVAAYLRAITGRAPVFYPVNVADPAALERIFAAHPIDAVLHFAGYKAVGESVARPVAYYRNNLDATLTLLEAMAAHGVTRIVFSSSATVYGGACAAPFDEGMPTGGCANPYGWTKCIIEQILTDAAKADPSLSVMLLRYFNPIGAHESGLLGERPRGVPANLMPYLTEVAAGLREKLSIFGSDYPTPDGTCVRDYIHVCDLAEGHALALDYAMTHTGVETVNLGTGRGYSVLEVVHAFEQANGIAIPRAFAPRRPGDAAVCYAGTEKAGRLLGFSARRGLEQMCRDAWRFQKRLLEREG